MGSVEPCILVVDDDRDLRESVIDALKDEGYPAVGKADGASALEYLKGTPSTCLILLDWNMAPMNGPQFIEALQRASIPIPPVVLFTADARHESLGGISAVGLLKKPVRLEELYRFAKAHCGHTQRVDRALG